MAELQVDRTAPATTRIVETDDDETRGALAEGQILARVDTFSFTANNVTYAVLGERIGYWRFFPPAGDAAEGWGVIPVWGFADVVASRADGIPVGDRLYGYLPPATSVVLTPTDVAPRRFVDGSPHRAELPAAYNRYERVEAEPEDDPLADAERALLAPLHLTSFCLWDALSKAGWYGATQVVVLSASSKTAIGLAHALHEDPEAPPTIGLTSARNREFVAGLGLYDATLTYDELEDVDDDVPTVVVDMAGDRRVGAALHRRLGEHLRHHLGVGLTHWDEQPGDRDEGFRADRASVFFAPGHVQERIAEWGPEEFGRRTAAFVRGAAAQSRAWMHVTEVDGLTGLADVLPDVCAGRLGPEQGVMVRM